MRKACGNRNKQKIGVKIAVHYVVAIQPPKRQKTATSTLVPISKRANGIRVIQWVNDIVGYEHNNLIIYQTKLF